MSILICKTLSRLRSFMATTSTNKLLYLQYHRFSSSALDSVTKCSNQESFTVSYLIHSFGFTPKKASIASKYLKFETPDKPDSVVAFFRKHNFDDTQISRIVRKIPTILLADCEKTLLPKLEYFNSVSVSNSQLTDLIAASPSILNCSLVKKIIPTFSFLNTLLPSNERTVRAFERFFKLRSHDLEARIRPNITTLRELGVPESNMVFLLTQAPGVLTTTTDNLKEIVKQVEQMGFKPFTTKFLWAIHVLNALTKETWEKKMEFLKNWGWSEDDIFVAFEKHPNIMIASKEKLSSVMDVLIKSGFNSSDVLRRPVVVSFSLEKRIIPRCSVHQVLLEKGLAGKMFSLSSLLGLTEKQFLKKITKCYKEAAPELLKVYQEKMELSGRGM